MGGGNSWLTESRPTCRPTFAKSVAVPDMESAASWHEVTDAQKRSLESAAAAYVPPSEPLKARAKAAGITWNDYTGYFELNGLTDLTAADVELILQFGTWEAFAKLAWASSYTYPSRVPQIRTTLPSITRCVVSSPSPEYPQLEWLPKALTVLRFGLDTSSTQSTFRWTRHLNVISDKLVEIQDRLVPTSDDLAMGLYDTGQKRYYATKLSTIYIYQLAYNINLRNLPALSYDSIAFMVQYAKNTTAITITLHADAFARLTDELIAEASAKNISFATP